jgi:hypothetical protein
MTNSPTDASAPMVTTSPYVILTFGEFLSGTQLQSQVAGSFQLPPPFPLLSITLVPFPIVK